jgi:predicted glutamine amidotransferase
MKAKFLLFIFLVTANAGFLADSHEHLRNQFYEIQPAVHKAIDLASDNSVHNCRFWAGISDNLASGIIRSELLLNPYSLKYLSTSRNIDGWGVAYYSDFGVYPETARGRLRARNDTTYDSTVNLIDASHCRIVLGHVRNCTNGCCCHGCESIPDLHPFVRFKGGFNWSFVHNGIINKSVLYNLIGDQYLRDNPPDGSGILECDPADTANITDSELFFIFLLKNIEENNWNVTPGLIHGLSSLIYADEAAALNFALTDGYEIWAFCLGNTLYYLADTHNNYCAAASNYTTEPMGLWQAVDDYNLVHLQADQQPIFYDLRLAQPPVVSCPGDTTLMFIQSRDVCLDGFNYSDPDNNIDSLVVANGNLLGHMICFTPHEGVQTVGLRVTDRQGGSAECSTSVNCILSEPGILTGVVNDSASAPIESVLVQIEGTDMSSLTDVQGQYQIDTAIPGVYRISFSRINYHDSAVNGVTIAPLDTTRLDMILASGCFYVPGDINGNGIANGIDVVYGVNYLKGGAAPPIRCDCSPNGTIYAAADVNGNCAFNGVDITYFVRFLKGQVPVLLNCPDCAPGER